MSEQLFDIATYGRYSCDRCFDLGIWQTPKLDVQKCPTIAAGMDHCEPNAAARMIARSIEHLRAEEFPVSPQAFDIARMLSRFATERPCDRQKLLSIFFSYLPMSEANKLRKFHSVIEELRKRWLLPVGSRKDAPSGYWICTEIDDFKEWVDRAKSAPVTQLTTIHRVAKRNFPIFAEQMEIEFFNDIQTDDSGPDVTFADADLPPIAA